MSSCAEWNAPQRPFAIHGGSYYVGTRGLGAILITSPAGHILIDAGLPESAKPIMASVRSLGFRVEDIRLIGNSHAPCDHAGGIAEIQRASGAAVAASPSTVPVLSERSSGTNDPQNGVLLPFPAVSNVRELADGDTLRVGPLAVTAHASGGHTPGGTTWSWQSCEQGRCIELVYADSQTPISADGFFFTRSSTYPTALDDFERGFAMLESTALRRAANAAS